MLARTWSPRNSLSLLVGMRNATAILEGSLAVSHKTKHSLTRLLVIYLNERKKYMFIKKIITLTWMFTGALFIIAKAWQQPRCSLVGEWIHELW